jgi:hypothetical protein
MVVGHFKPEENSPYEQPETTGIYENRWNIEIFIHVNSK